MDENVSNILYKKEGKILPKIDYIEFSLLNQSVNMKNLVDKYFFKFSSLISLFEFKI